MAAALQAGGYGRRECVARINALDTPWGLDDARALAAAGADAVLLPRSKARPSWTRWRGHWTRPARPPTFPCGPCAKRRWAFCVWTPSPAIPGWRPWSWHVGPGQDLHARHTPGREETLLARSLAIMAARAHGLAALDGVHLDLDDDAGLALACEQGRNQGFDGKTLIHPRQIAAANAAYAPSPGEIAVARKRLQAWRDAQASGQGVAVVDGSLVENLHAREAERVLALAAAIAAA